MKPSTRPRDDASAVRQAQVLEFCANEPRTMEEILDECGQDQRYRYAVYNAVARGQMVNLNAERGRRFPGLFKATSEGRADCKAPPRAPTGRVNSVWQLGAMG